MDLFNSLNLGLGFTEVGGVDIFGKTFEKMKVKNQVIYNERFEKDETYFPFLGVFLEQLLRGRVFRPLQLFTLVLIISLTFLLVSSPTFADIYTTNIIRSKGTTTRTKTFI